MRSTSLRGVLAKSGSVGSLRPFVRETRRHWSDRVVQNSLLLFLDPYHSVSWQFRWAIDRRRGMKDAL
jgi:hypothetical protein